MRGYDQTEQFFDMFETNFLTLTITGPKRAGQDVNLNNIFTGYPSKKRPIDFLILKNTLFQAEDNVLAVGLARYDSDRGGAQEDDRTGQYRECADEVLMFAQSKNLKVKVIFLNDGPGLLLGTMWDDYANLEKRWPGKVMVLTLRMVPARLTLDWLLS